MLLAAHMPGMRCCWIVTVDILGTSQRANYYAAELGIPRAYTLFFGVALGYSASEN